MKRNLLLAFGIELHNYSCIPNTVLKWAGKETRFNARSLTNTCHLASSFDAKAKRTLRGMIWGSTSSEELKIRAMFKV